MKDIKVRKAEKEMSVLIEWDEGEVPEYTYKGIPRSSLVVQALDKCKTDVRLHWSRGVPLCKKGE